LDNGHGMLLKQKSPPVAGGQSMIVANRSVAPSRRRIPAVPPEVDGAGCGDGIQVRHRDSS
jgi:hypothetical protein